MSDIILNQRQSPNYDHRPKQFVVDMLVLHYTGMQDCRSALERLCDSQSKVSAHYLIDEDGICYQLVSELNRAWHAGRSSWKNETDINSLSIGIELVNPGHELGYKDFPEQQLLSLEHLIFDIKTRYKIPNHRILGHSDVAPLRKKDPGELFNWHRLFLKGIGIWPKKTHSSTMGAIDPTSRLTNSNVEDIQNQLALFGYQVNKTGIYDLSTKKVVESFQRHFRPARVDGIFDNESSSRLNDLLCQVKE